MSHSRAGLALFAASLSACAASSPPSAPPALPPPAPTRSPAPAAAGPIAIVPQRINRDAGTATLSPNGTLVALITPDGVHVVDPATSVSRGVLAGCFLDAYFVSDGNALLAVPCEARAEGRLWDLTADRVRVVGFPDLPEGPIGPTAVTPTGSHVAVARENVVEILAVGSDHAVRCEGATPAWITAVAITPDGRRAVAAAGNEIIVCDAAGKRVATLTAPWTHLQAVAIADDGEELAAGAREGLVLGGVRAGVKRASKGPCGDAATTSVAWSPRGDALALGCAATPGTPRSARTRALVADGEGHEVRELASATEGDFSVGIDARGSNVSVAHSNLGARLYALATGALVFEQRVTCGPLKMRPCRRVSWSSNFDRVLVGGNGQYGTLQVLATRADVDLPALELDDGPRDLEMTADGRIAVESAHGGREILDPSTGARRGIDPAEAEDETSPDGTLLLRNDQSTRFTLVVQSTGEERTYDTRSREGTAPRQFSEAGGYVIEDEGYQSNGESSAAPRSINLYDVKTGSKVKRFPCVGLSSSFVMTRDDARIALRSFTGRRQDGSRSEDAWTDDTHVVRVHDVATTRLLATIGPFPEGASLDGFSPDGTLIVVGGRFFDARTGKLAWAAPPDHDFLQFHGARAALFRTFSPRGLRALDPATGASLAELRGAQRVLAERADKGLLLTWDAPLATLWDTRSWTRRAVIASVNEPRQAFLSADGGYVYFTGGGQITVHRIADGRRLTRFFLGATPVDFTDEGIVNHASSGPGAFMLRVGASVLTSPMTAPSSDALPFVREHLFADFISGRPVGPAPP